MSPSAAGITTMSTSRDSSSFSGLTISRLMGIGSGVRLHRFGFGDRFLDGADHVEGAFRQVVVFAGADRLEAAHRLRDRNELARKTGEYFGHMERLRQETLDFPGARHDQFVLL